MPFTLAHPAVVLPIRHSNYWHKPALILGSMSPDFVYFLHGEPISNVGHTAWGFLLINLPLCGLLFYVYQKFIGLHFWQTLPIGLQLPPLGHLKKPSSFNSLIFCGSAIFGMFTHIFLDSFTHSTGWFVQHFDIFQQVYFDLALYKWLQYLGGVLGLVIIIGYWVYWAKRNPLKSNMAKKVKFHYWLGVSILTASLLLLWQLCEPIGLHLMVNWVIRGIDCIVLALVAMGCWLNIRHKKT